MVLILHDSAPIQAKLNYIEDKAYPSLKELGGKMSRYLSQWKEQSVLSS